MKTKRLFAVMEIDGSSGALQQTISHWYYDNINDANAACKKMSDSNGPDYEFVVVDLLPGKKVEE